MRRGFNFCSVPDICCFDILCVYFLLLSFISQPLNLKWTLITARSLTMLSTVVMKKTQIIDSRTPDNSRVLDGKIVYLDHARQCSPLIFISFCWVCPHPPPLRPLSTCIVLLSISPQSTPQGYKTFFSSSTQLSTKFQLFIKTKIPTNEEVFRFKSLRWGIYHANKC